MQATTKDTKTAKEVDEIYMLLQNLITVELNYLCNITAF